MFEVFSGEDDLVQGKKPDNCRVSDCASYRLPIARYARSLPRGKSKITRRFVPLQKIEATQEGILNRSFHSLFGEKLVITISPGHLFYDPPVHREQVKVLGVKCTANCANRTD